MEIAEQDMRGSSEDFRSEEELVLIDKTKRNICYICDKDLKVRGYLRDHFGTNHFFNEIIEQFGRPDELVCPMCGFKNDKNKTGGATTLFKNVVRHMGSVHRGIEPCLPPFLRPIVYPKSRSDSMTESPRKAYKCE